VFKNIKTNLFLTLITTVLLITSAQAEERWFISATANGSAAKYSDSKLRDNSITGSAWLNIGYLDYYDLTVAYNNLNINYKDIGTGEFAVNQQAVAGRFKLYSYNDTLGGRITTQLTAHRLTNDAPTTIADDVLIFAPKLAYLSYSKSFYLDLEYVWSSYSNSNNLIIQQLSPSIGFGFNQNNDWLEFKAYQTISSDKIRSQGEDSLTAASIKWQHWFNPGPVLGIHHFTIDVLGGQRMFAVDNESFTVYNPDVCCR